MSKLNTLNNASIVDDDISIEDVSSNILPNSDSSINITKDRFAKENNVKPKEKEKQSKYALMTSEERHRLISDFNPVEIKDFPYRPIKTILIVS